MNKGFAPYTASFQARVEIVSPELLHNAEQQLADIPGGIEVAMKRAMNRATAHLRTQSTREIRKRYDIARKDIRAEQNITTSYAAFVMQLARPLVHDEKTYTELTFNFEDLSGNDSLAIERELQMLGHTVIVANFDSEYLIRVCVKACTEKLGLDALGKLSIRDFNRLRNTVRGFLSRKE